MVNRSNGMRSDRKAKIQWPTCQLSGAKKHGGEEVSLDDAFALIEAHPKPFPNFRVCHPPIIEKRPRYKRGLFITFIRGRRAGATIPPHQ